MCAMLFATIDVRQTLEPTNGCKLEDPLHASAGIRSSAITISVEAETNPDGTGRVVATTKVI